MKVHCKLPNMIKAFTKYFHLIQTEGNVKGNIELKEELLKILGHSSLEIL